MTTQMNGPASKHPASRPAARARPLSHDRRASEMSSPALPPDVRQFIVASIPSVPFAEALLLFHRRQADGLTRKDVARDLYMTDVAVSRLLDALETAGFIAVADDGERKRYRYCVDESRACTVDRFSSSYHAKLVEVTQLIHDRPKSTRARSA